jgi:alkanesulfonate monooxygenase SsuD/methylene tetrahydromethanopterin reductase-like flavin-dependent oxidoreductase (luciferase family)
MSAPRFSINIPNFGDFADADTVARVASAAEAAGWDGLFLWDHVVHRKRDRRSFGDPWMLLTAAALATSRIKLGPMVTPIPRRRPEQLARQVSTLDNLSGGRVIFGAGLGAPIEDEYGSFGEPTDPKLPPSGSTRASISWTATGRASRSRTTGATTGFRT